MLRVNSKGFPRVASSLCILLLFLAGCRQSTLLHSPRANSRNGYRPASPGSLSSYIRTALRISAEKGPKAEQDLKRAHEQDPDLVKQAEESSTHPADLQAGLSLAESYMKAGLYYPAYEVYQRLAAAGQTDVRIELALAAIWDKWQDFSLARDHAEAAVELDPQCAEGWNLLGKIHLHREDFANAATSFERALTLDQSDAVLFANAGYAFLRIDQMQKAEVYLEKALSLDGTIVEAHNHLGIVLARLGRCDSALTHFNQTSDPAVALNNLGTVLLAQGKRDQAGAYFKQALALKPDYEKARASLGEVDRLGAPPSRIRLDSALSPSITEAPTAPPSAVSVAALAAPPARVTISITPVPAPQPPIQASVPVDSELVEIQKVVETDNVVIGKDAYRLPKGTNRDERPVAAGRPIAFYRPILPSALQSAINLAVNIKVPDQNLVTQAPRPRTGPAGAGTSRTGANLKITALEWQEPLLNPVALADVALGRSTSPHSDPAGRLYVPSGANLIFSGLFAFAVVIGLLLAGSFRAVVGISLIFAGVAVVLIAL